MTHPASPQSLDEWLRAAYADPAAGCPPPEAWLEEELAARLPEERRRLEAHAARCPACAAERDLAQGFDAGPEAAGVHPEDVAFVVSRLEARSPVGNVRDIAKFRDARREPSKAVPTMPAVPAVASRRRIEFEPRLAAGRRRGAGDRRGADVPALPPRRAAAARPAVRRRRARRRGGDGLPPGRGRRAARRAALDAAAGSNLLPRTALDGGRHGSLGGHGAGSSSAPARRGVPGSSTAPWPTVGRSRRSAPPASGWEPRSRPVSAPVPRPKAREVGSNVPVILDPVHFARRCHFMIRRLVIAALAVSTLALVFPTGAPRRDDHRPVAPGRRNYDPQALSLPRPHLARRSAPGLRERRRGRRRR